MRKLLLLLFLFTLSSNALAKDDYADMQDHEIPSGNVSLCKETDAIGFNWEDGKWIKSNYKPAEFVIKKIPYKDIDKDGLILCRKIDETKNKLTSTCCADVMLTEEINRCYAIRDFGAEVNMFDYTICKETYHNKILENVICKKDVHIEFLPNGLFFKRSNMILDLRKNPEGNYKDSIVISHGICASVN